MAKSFDDLVSRTTTKETQDSVTLRTKELLHQLDEDFRKHVDEGLRQLDAGESVEHEEARRRLGKWLK